MKPRSITIISVLNGYKVQVGCKEVVFSSKKKLLKELRKYLDDPENVQKKYLEKYDTIAMAACEWSTPQT